MPGSSKVGKLAIAEWFSYLPEKATILDIGPGWGTYVKLLKHSGQKWHCVEIHKPYVETFKLKDLYDKVFIKDIRKFDLPKKYDVVLLGDVLEHVNLKDGQKLLKKVFTSAKYCLVSLPLDGETGADDYNAEDYWQNPNEQHLARWTSRGFLEQVLSLNKEIIAMEKYQELAIYLIACETNKQFLLSRRPQPFLHLASRFSYKLDYDPRRFQDIPKKILSKLARMLSRGNRSK